MRRPPLFTSSERVCSRRDGLSAGHESRFSAYIYYAGDQCEPAVDIYSTRILTHLEAMTEPDAVTRVEEALCYINETSARLLKAENRLRNQGHHTDAAGCARARAVLMPVRAILRGE
jgi:hypothetical protein